MSRDTMFHSSQNVENQIGNVRHVRVHAPPGGVTSFSLGWGSEPAPAARPSRGSGALNAYAPGAMPVSVEPAMYAAPATYPSKFAAAEAPVKENIPTANAMPEGKVSSNNYATGANQNCGNMITERRITKIAAPPGGRTSIVLG